MGNESSIAAESDRLMAMDGGIDDGGVELALPDRTRRMAEGDEEAWRWFHRRYYLALLRYAARRAGDPSDAGEIVQQGYLRIARHIRPFAAEGDFWNWLCCVVRCAAADHGRNASRRLVLLEKWAHWRAVQAPEEARWPAAAELAPALVEEALGRLPGDEAVLLRRKYCDGWSTQELATDLGTTPKAVENRLARLRGRLREIILHLR